MKDSLHSMRLKINGDTFFLPDQDGVYFRNNQGSIHIAGRTIHQWIEKLIPMFNGELSLKELTDELPEPHRKQVYEITEVLYQNSFLRDVNQDRSHQLSKQILEKFAPQIEFLDSLGTSGGYHFQNYRQSKVLAVGSGPFLISLVTALFESGLPKFHVLITESVKTNREQLKKIEAYARKADSEVKFYEVTCQGVDMQSWLDIVHPFDSILYASQETDIEQLRNLHSACREYKKVFIPAMCVHQVGLAGPLVNPNSEGCWESAWRRIHQSTISKNPKLHTFSSTASAMLANVIVFELFKYTTQVAKPILNNSFFLLNFETLEGSWHSFLPHPLVTNSNSFKWVHDLTPFMERQFIQSTYGLIPYFDRLTSAEAGIFHTFEEGDLIQLPLAQCRVQAADPLSEGPTPLLPDVICAGRTHYEARREAGLIGIESYVSRMMSAAASMPSLHKNSEKREIEWNEFVGIGAGETSAEGICRGLQRCLMNELVKQQADRPFSISPAQLGTVDDARCQFYLQALTTMHGQPTIGLGQKVCGFPVVWIGTRNHWHGSVGLNMTMAFQKALEHALMTAQNESSVRTTQALEVSSVYLEENSSPAVTIFANHEVQQFELLQFALQVLKQNQRRILVLDLALEPFLKEEELAGVFGILLRQEESP